MRSALLASLIAVVAGCPHHPGTNEPGRGAPYVAAYPALAWVPADATYVLTAHRTADAVAVARELTMVAGLYGDFDLAEAEAAMRKELGVDLLSIDGLKDAGVDPDGGLAIFSQGLSPTLAIALRDPQRTTGLIEEQRGGSVVEVSREHGVDVYTFAGERDVHLHWAIADRWLFVHLELTDEREPELAWYRGLRAAAAGYAAGPDLADSQRAGAVVGASPPLLGVAQLPALRARLARLGAPSVCVDTFAGTRMLVAAGVAGKDAIGAVTVEVAGHGAADAILATPSGWERARAGAPIQAEWSADLDRVAAWLAPCDAGLAQQIRAPGLRAARGFVHTFDLGALEGKGAAWVAAKDDHLFREALDQVPGLSYASHHRKVGAADVVDVSIPLVPSFSYAMSANTAVAAMGAGVIDAALGDGRDVRGTSIAHVEVHPNGLAPELWDQILDQLAQVKRADARTRTIRRLRRWDLGQIDVTAGPGAVTLTAHGVVH